MLLKFLYRNLKGFRVLVMLAIIVTILEVGCSIAAAFPLKFIPGKVTNAGNDPACTFPFLNPILDKFDTPLFDPSLAPLTPNGPNQSPGLTPCPISPSDPNPILVTTHHSTNGVIVFSVLMLIIFGTITALLGYLDLYIAAYIAQNLTARLRNELFEHLQRLSLDWHGKQKKGDLVQRVTGNIADIEKLVTDGLVDFLSASLIIIGVIIVMLLTSWQFTILSIVILPALILVVASYTFGIKGAAKKASKAAGQVANVATEDVGAITVLKAFTLEERESIRFTKYVDKNRKAGLRAGGLQAQFTPIVAILVAIGTAIIIGVGSYVASGQTFTFWILAIPAGTVTFGTLTVFLSYLGQFYQPLRDLSKLMVLITNAASGAERIQEVLDAAPEIVDSGAPYYGPTKLRGEIIYENVIFGYSKDRPILKGINLHIAAGKKVALVGLSGGGKTTLVKLIPRFYEIQQGSVRLDGADNRMYPLAILRQNVSMVLQDSVLFEGTIRENIEIGRPGATDEQIIDAANKAQIHDTIIKMPDGYTTEVREQGKNFSGGQRQRLAIARAVLRDAPILILDEPTAALDVEAEAEVMHALDKLVLGRTVLMISHRLSKLGNVNEIIVLKDGRIVEQGTFKDLKQRGGVFAGLLDEQNRYNLDRAGNESILRPVFRPGLEAANPYQLPSAPAQPAQWGGPPPISPVPGWSPPAQQPVPVAMPAPARGYAYAGRQQAQAQARGQQPQQAAAMQQARVLVEIDGKVVSERRLDKSLLTVGRLSENDVQVPSQRVSRLHAKIRWDNGAWLIEDAESLNGLVYKGQLVERLTLKNGDRIHVAPTAVLQYVTM